MPTTHYTIEEVDQKLEALQGQIDELQVAELPDDVKAALVVIANYLKTVYG